ncbi:hypothetical protein [Thioalkalivibrio sp. ALMg11]|uniref:hypothetical protein n=1 Tax=Thioalkalivibrio sp. ALMg11 TaxID=1158165 RepID=UPI000381B62C|nr:hypothetical protein [Thioalkalivibrio sp. ALMg11]
MDNGNPPEQRNPLRRFRDWIAPSQTWHVTWKVYALPDTARKGQAPQEFVLDGSFRVPGKLNSKAFDTLRSGVWATTQEALTNREVEGLSPDPEDVRYITILNLTRLPN